MTKRVFIAALGTETNQFVPFPTGLRGYQEHGIWRGDATRHQPTNFTAPMHVWRKKAEERGWTVIEGLATFAAPSGTTVRKVYEDFRDEVLAGVKAALPLDAVLINVHGAMVADGYDDCEGDLLAKVRAIVGPKVAIGAEFDLHCHLSALMLDSADVLVGYKEYPHTDTMERAAELFEIIADTALGKVKPVMARYDCRMIAQYRTSVPPISEFVVRMKSLEGKDGILSVSLSHGFSFADVEDVGTRTLVVADGDLAKAEKLAKQLGRTLHRVGVRVFLVADKHVGAVEHQGAQVAVQVEFGADRDLRADDGAHLGQEVAFAVVIAVGHHGAVDIDQHGIERQGGFHAGQDLVAEILVDLAHRCAGRGGEGREPLDHGPAALLGLLAPDMHRRGEVGGLVSGGVAAPDAVFLVAAQAGRKGHELIGFGPEGRDEDTLGQENYSLRR